MNIIQVGTFMTPFFVQYRKTKQEVRALCQSIDSTLPFIDSEEFVQEFLKQALQASHFAPWRSPLLQNFFGEEQEIPFLVQLQLRMLEGEVSNLLYLLFIIILTVVVCM